MELCRRQQRHFLLLLPAQLAYPCHVLHNAQPAATPLQLETLGAFSRKGAGVTGTLITPPMKILAFTSNRLFRLVLFESWAVQACI